MGGQNVWMKGFLALSATYFGRDCLNHISAYIYATGQVILLQICQLVGSIYVDVC